MTITIYHNPRCSKSRQTLELLRERGIEPRIIEYLKDPPDERTLAGLLDQLGITVTDIMRTGEQDYREARANLAAMTAGDQMAWLCDHPQVIQRPIVVSENGARIGRPPEAVLEILP